MAAVSKSFYETPDRQGLVIGILPSDESLEQSSDGSVSPDGRLAGVLIRRARTRPSRRTGAGWRTNPTSPAGTKSTSGPSPAPGGVSDGGPKPKDGYPNRWVEIPVLTHLPLSGERGTEPMSRNHINVLSSDVIVALSGDAGTLSEVRLAVRYGRPVIAFVELAKMTNRVSSQIRGSPGCRRAFQSRAAWRKYRRSF